MTKTRAHRSERGASIVESAIVFPLVMLMIMGLLEGALMFRAYLSASNGSAGGARIGSIDGTAPLTDYDILQAVARTATGASKSQIQNVVVYKAYEPDDQPSAACINQAHVGGTGIVGECNVYTNADLSLPPTRFGISGTGQDLYWAPSTRSLSLSAGTDYLGVWVEMNCQCLATSLFGISPQLHGVTVIRIEAQKA